MKSNVKSGMKSSAKNPAVWTTLSMAIIGAVRAFSKTTITEEQAQALMLLVGAVGSLVGYYMLSPREQKAKKIAALAETIAGVIKNMPATDVKMPVTDDATSAPDTAPGTTIDEDEKTK